MNPYLKRTFIGLLVLISPFLFLYISLFFNWFGKQPELGNIDNQSAPSFSSQTTKALNQEKRILFGDLHVHTTYSLDAFLGSLPILEGEGVHPVADACNFSRFCANLDFFSVTDHAEFLTRREWEDTIESLQSCSAISKNKDDEEIVPFLGWEWTQTSLDPSKHYGHKNVILKPLEGDLPARPIGALESSYLNFIDTPFVYIYGALIYDYRNMSNYFDWRHRNIVIQDIDTCKKGVHVKDLPKDCLERVEKPAELFSKLDEWGIDSIVIPHGTAWGNTSPPMASWENQFDSLNHDQKYQKLIELYSGHGNTEEYRSWRSFNLDNGAYSCPQPTADFIPYCFQAGEVIRERCRVSAGSASECDSRAKSAREEYVKSNPFGILTVPQYDSKEWLESGQCLDCFLPAFDYRPRSSIQYALALRNFDDDKTEGYRFGFIGSSDNHGARPGTGYKEIDRIVNSDSKYKSTGPLTANPNDEDSFSGIPKTQSVDLEELMKTRTGPPQLERISSFLYTGGLVATHSIAKDRNSIWDSLNNREVYATSGERILLWFDVINHPSMQIKPMGSEFELNINPRFRVRAVGSQKQLPGCNVGEGFNPEVINRLCKGECFNPSDERKLITRIEVVRIRPQAYSGEPIENLIEDPWKVFMCDPSSEGCEVEFTDDNFTNANREIIYYVRAIQEPSLAINASNLNCDRDDSGKCIKVNLCGDVEGQGEGDCLFETEERAWSSPVFIKSVGGQP